MQGQSEPQHLPYATLLLNMWAQVWESSVYAHLLNSELNQACRAITGCLKPTNIENLYLLVGIVPPEIRRSICARVERTKQEERDTHSLFGHTPPRSFLTSVQPVHFPAKVVRVNQWKRRLEEKATSGGAVTADSSCCANCVEPPRHQQWGP